MSQLVRLEGKHTYQNTHCAVGKQKTRNIFLFFKNLPHTALSEFASGCKTWYFLPRALWEVFVGHPQLEEGRWMGSHLKADVRQKLENMCASLLCPDCASNIGEVLVFASCARGKRGFQCKLVLILTSLDDNMKMNEWWVVLWHHLKQLERPLCSEIIVPIEILYVCPVFCPWWQIRFSDIYSFCLCQLLASLADWWWCKKDNLFSKYLFLRTLCT